MKQQHAASELLSLGTEDSISCPRKQC